MSQLTQANDKVMIMLNFVNPNTEVHLELVIASAQVAGATR